MNRQVLGVFATVAALAGGSSDALAQAPTGPPGAEECFTVADTYSDENDGRAEDLLIRVDRADPDVSTNETNVGSGTGTRNVEAIALQPGTGVLFATDAGELGTIDTETGRYSAIGPVGRVTGPEGDREVRDVDGLSFDPATGFLYGSERRSSAPDLFLRIDPTTGAAVPGAVAGADYAVVPPVAKLTDIDDLAVDPVDGQMYAVANTDGRQDRLVKIDKATGLTTDIGVMEAQDVEGLGFASGQLIGTTGKVFDREGIWDIDKATGQASNRRALDNGRDYEGFDCLNPAGPPAAPTACLVVMEDARPDDPVDFPFATTGGLPDAEFVLDDDGDDTLPAMTQSCDLPPGEYTVTQVTPPDWPLTDVDCSDPTDDSLIEVAGGLVSAVLAPGETVTCRFVNEPRPGPTPPTPKDTPPAPKDTPLQPRGGTVPPDQPTEALPRTRSFAPPAISTITGAPELPRTGDGNRVLVLMSGLALALGGAGVAAGANRRRPR